MKKLLFTAFIAASLVACNSVASTETESRKDSTINEIENTTDSLKNNIDEDADSAKARIEKSSDSVKEQVNEAFNKKDSLANN